MAKADKKDAQKKRGKEPPPPAAPGDDCSGPESFDLVFNIKFKRRPKFLGHTDREHALHTICWCSDYDPPEKFVIAPIEATKGAALEKQVAEHRRNRMLLSVALALSDAEFDYTLSNLRKKG